VTDNLSGSGALGQGITTYVYDNALRLTKITQSAGGTTGPEVTMAYDAVGLITMSVFSNDGLGDIVKTKYAYDSAENLTTLSSYFSFEGQSASPSPYASDVDTYNADGQLTAISITGIASGASNAYSYDSDGQLTGSSGTSNITYGYDANGNPDTTGYTTGAGNEMTHSPGVTYTYDNVGNMITATTSSGTTTYTYDFANRMTNVDINGTMAATYTYDALGRRISIDDSGTKTWTVYNGKTADDNPYADFTSSGSLNMRYVDGLAIDELFARTDSSGNTAWYLRDNVGSFYADVTTTMVLDAVVYDPYGNLVTETNASEGDRFKFAGMEYDSVTGLYYDHARYYDAAIGRFVSQDPMGFAAGDSNLYRYVTNSPTESTDPTGAIDWPTPIGGQLKIAPGFSPPPGLPLQYIPEQYQRDLPALPMQRSLPPYGENPPADAIVIGGPTGGLYKFQNGSVVLLKTDMRGNIVIIQLKPPTWGRNTWYPANGGNTFRANIPGTPIDEGKLPTPTELEWREIYKTGVHLR
jgi:RHS repeat-associated protein